MTDIELVVVERDRQRIVPQPRRAIDELLRRIWNLVVWVVRRVGVEFNFEHREPPVLYSSASFRRAPLQYTGRRSGGGTSPDGITVIPFSVACRAKGEIPSLANGRGRGGTDTRHSGSGTPILADSGRAMYGWPPNDVFILIDVGVGVRSGKEDCIPARHDDSL